MKINSSASNRFIQLWFCCDPNFFIHITYNNKIYWLSLKEYEKKIVPWLYAFAAFASFRILATIFFGIVNDLIFAYNVIMLLIWIIICFGSVYGWLVVYSLYLELVDLTKLEDLAHLRVSYQKQTQTFIIKTRE